MSDFPAPIPPFNEENNLINDYPEKIILNNVTLSTNEKPNSITISSFCEWHHFIFLFAFLGFGIGFTFLGINEENIGLIIGSNVFTLIGIAFCFCLSYSGMTIDMIKKNIIIKKCKIYYCKKYTFNINDIEEIVLTVNNSKSYYKGETRYDVFDINIVFPGGRSIVGATKIDENGEAMKVYNNLRNILPEHIKIRNNFNE